jgi:hypothetical protein
MLLLEARQTWSESEDLQGNSPTAVLLSQEEHLAI